MLLEVAHGGRLLRLRAVGRERAEYEVGVASLEACSSAVVRVPSVEVDPARFDDGGREANRVLRPRGQQCGLREVEALQPAARGARLEDDRLGAESGAVDALALVDRDHPIGRARDRRPDAELDSHEPGRCARGE